MPPKRCPECGRFLSNELVASLASSSVPCPRCDTPLSTDTIVGGSGSASGVRGSPRSQPVVTAAAVGPAAGVEAQEAPTPRKGASVRPPDLDPRDVQTVDDDVLAGWDLGATDDEIAAWRRDRRPFPTDTVVVAVGAVLGGVLGSAISARRPLGAGAGILGGAVAAGAARRVWELRP